eukprot:TRINITY_DN99630_c0_g1_i1.p1 TRINITY_DN99630_c0_g1~~TRINITY_DN99630_c0_g1_i1.p1  ORF type:complete len:113 (+),score=19.73 TRINITY_DN99630_c0_g1_i1:28-339(+)
MAKSVKMMDDKLFAIIIWALIWATIFAPLVFRKVLANYMKNLEKEGHPGIMNEIAPEAVQDFSPPTPGDSDAETRSPDKAKKEKQDCDLLTTVTVETSVPGCM